MKIKLRDIQIKAKERPTGYLEDVLSKGKVIGDYLEISPENYLKLTSKYRQSPPKLPKRCCGR